MSVIWVVCSNVPESLGRNPFWSLQSIYTILQNKRMRDAGWPPTNNFRKTQVPQQVIHRRKGEFMGESESFKILGKCFEFVIL